MVEIEFERVTPRTILAEASAYSDAYQCDAVGRSALVLQQLPKPAFLKLLRSDDAFSRLWSAHLASEVRAARCRIDILSRRTVAARLDGWLAWHGGDALVEGPWKSVAEQIGVSAEALYREIVKRRSK